MSRIESQPISQVSWVDVEALVGQIETPTLEFKKDLSSKKGGLHAWHEGGSLDPHARDSLAAEVVAFANAWGGTIILGAEEAPSGGQAVFSKIAPLPRVEALARQLEDALLAVIDPPIPSLVCHPIRPEAQSSAGIVIVRVSRSALAPHGFGEPARAYVRRGTRAVPMAMSDIQNAFWDGRMRSERILQRRRTAETFLNEKVIERGLLNIDPMDGGIFARYSILPHESLALSDLDALEMWTKLLRPNVRALFNTDVFPPFGSGPDGWHPEPVAHGIRVLKQGTTANALWQISEDGSIEIWGYCQARTLPGRSLPIVHPHWMTAAVGQMLTMVEYMRRRAGKPGVAFEIDCTLVGDHSMSEM